MNPEDVLHHDIVRALIEATPEWWKFARLELQPTCHDDTRGCQHVISNPQCPHDYVEATDNLCLATRNLVSHYKKGHMWATAVYEIVEDGNGEWKFKVDFAY